MSNQNDEDKIVHYGGGSRVSRKALKCWIHAESSRGNGLVASALRSLGDIVLSDKVARQYQSAKIAEIVQFEKDRKNRKHAERVEQAAKERQKSKKNRHLSS